MDLSDFLASLPEHECSLELQHNGCRDYYQTVAQMVEDKDQYPMSAGSWISEEQKAKAIETNDYWCLHWYPKTPIGFYVLLACDLEALLEEAKRGT